MGGEASGRGGTENFSQQDYLMVFKNSEFSGLKKVRNLNVPIFACITFPLQP